MRTRILVVSLFIMIFPIVAFSGAEKSSVQTISTSQQSQAEAQATLKSISKGVQNLKQDVVSLNKDLRFLEETILFPSSTKYSVFVSMSAGQFFSLESVKLKLDGKLVATHIYLAARALAHIEEVEALGGMAAAIEAGIPKLRIEESAARIQARIDSGAQTVVGVNKYLSSEKDDIPILRVDNDKVRQGQIARLEQLKAGRDTDAAMAALDALTKSADTGDGNLLALAVDAARKKATVGEISSALEKVYGRYAAKASGVTGVYSSAFDQSNPSYAEAVRRIKAFAELEGRAPKIMIAKMGQDGHDRGQKVVATAFKDIGFDVVIGPLFQTPEESAKMGIENGVDVIAASSLAAGHLTLIPELRKALKDNDRGDIMIVVGGVVPPEDIETLKEMGAKAVFPPGTNIPEAVLEVLDVVNMRLSQGA